MKVAAVIAEYNPFHNGHALQLERTRELTGATHVVAVMSGDFVQRGDAACVDKRTRALMAVRCGADLVVELPLPWAMAGAETFARGGVGIAAAVGCVDVLSFGSECGNIDLIRRTAELSDSEDARRLLKERLSEGASFAAARGAVLSEIAPECADILANPNDTLGVEYCRAINMIAPQMQPFCVQRKGAAHDSHAAHDGQPVSASYIRERLRAGAKPSDLAEYMPPSAAELLCEAAGEGRGPADISRLDRALLMRLRSMTVQQLAELPDVSEGLEHRIAECARRMSGADAGFAQLCDDIKCKRYTHARLRRILLSALLGITSADSEGTPPYIRVLAMNRRGQEILTASAAARGENGLPLITRYAQVSALDDRGRRIFELCADAADIYGLLLPEVPPAGSDRAYRLPVEQ